jgi:putative N6-adenine-specific DNA methylase
VQLARANLLKAGLSGWAMFRHLPFERLKPPDPPGVLIMNPPYGERLDPGDIEQFYRQIGDRFKQQYQGYEAWILSGNPEAMKHVGLRADVKMQLYNGPLACKFHCYKIYAGSRE